MADERRATSHQLVPEHVQPVAADVFVRIVVAGAIDIRTKTNATEGRGRIAVRSRRSTVIVSSSKLRQRRSARKMANRRWIVVAAAASVVAWGCAASKESTAVPATVLDAPSTASGPAAPTCADQHVAVSARPQGGFEPPPLPSDDTLLRTQVAESFCAARWTIDTSTEQLTFPLRPILPAAEAACIGDGLVTELGPARVRELTMLGSGPWSTLSFGLGANRGPHQLGRAEAVAIVDIFGRCTRSWKLMLALSVTAGAEKIGDDSGGCITEQLDDGVGRHIFAGELDRAYDDAAQPSAEPFPQLIAPLVDVFSECLTPAELDALDFN
jgi:hypothetical protein